MYIFQSFYNVLVRFIYKNVVQSQIPRLARIQMYFLPCTPLILPYASRDTIGETTPKRKQPVIGSWIVSCDANDIPYWTSSVSKETTYRLFVQRTSQPGMPLIHAGNGKVPPWVFGPPDAAPSLAKSSKKDNQKGPLPVKDAWPYRSRLTPSAISKDTFS